MKITLLLTICILLPACTCPCKDMVLRGVNQKGEKVWMYLHKGDLDPGQNEWMKLTPEEARKEQEESMDMDPDDRKFEI